MKTHIYLILLCCFSAFYSSAQPQWQWAKKDASVNYTINPTYPRQVVAAFNGKALWGSLQTRKTIYGSVAMGDYMLRELDSAGNATSSLYAKGRFALLQAQADAAGNWYVLGTFYDSVILSSTMMLSRDSFGNGAAYFLCRLHAGTLAPDWLTTIGNNTNCTAASISVSGNSVYLPMDTSLSTVYIKYNAATGAPTTLWKQTGRSSTTYIQVDSAGNIYVTGNCVINGAINFNGTTPAAPASGKYPWYVARYRANGQLHWLYYLTDITCNSHAFKLDGNNAVYLSGMLADSTSIGGYHFNKPLTMFNSDYVLARLDSSGNLIWAQQRPFTGSTQGGIYFTTQYHTTVLDTMLYMYCETQGNSTWGSGINTSTSSRHFSTLVAYNAGSGNAQWAKTVTGIYTLGHHIITDGYSLWVTGNGSDSNALKFDTVSVATSVGQYIPYVAKMPLRKRATTSGGGTTGLPPQAAVSISVFPNPAQGIVTVSNLTGGEVVTLRDLTGKAVSCELQLNHGHCILETSRLPRSVYFLEIKTRDGMQVTRLVLE